MRICPKCGKRFEGSERFCSKDGAPLVDDADETGGGKTDPLVGSLLAGRYGIARKLGEGGMGTVYLAEQATIGRRVAIKVLREELAAQVGTVRRFLREALACCKLDHPNIVSVTDFGRDEAGRYFLVMEVIEGVALLDVIGKEGRLPQPRAIHILDQVLSAAAAAHHGGVVHRDLKPENVFCVPTRGDPDYVKVLDFGLAKLVGEDRKSGRLTQEGFVVGTPEFMSPEQAWGRPVDHRSDLYAIGIIGYEMLTGALPFTGSAPEVARLHITKQPKTLRAACPEAKIHPDLEEFVLTLLAKDPSHRFQSAEAARNALGTIARRIDDQAATAGNVLERTRAVMQPRSVAAMEVLRGADGTPIRMEVAARDDPTAYLGKGITSPWEASELLEEIGRLARLWSRRVVEAANLLWGDGARPPEVERDMARASDGETRIVELETEIAVQRDKAGALDTEARRQDAEHRFRRLDLVAQLGAIEAGERVEVVTGRHAEADDLFPDEDTQPSTELAAVGGPGQGPEAHAIREMIDEVDRLSAGAALRYAREIGLHEEQISAGVEEVRQLRDDLVPVYASLAAAVKQYAAGRRELDDHVKALAEVVGAIQVYQSMLRAADA